jgi:hypothetical protein
VCGRETAEPGRVASAPIAPHALSRCVVTRAFIIRPFLKKKDSSGREINFERIDEQLILPALRAAKVSGETVGEIIEAGNIRADMFGLILTADLVICDITIHNANVFYELGVRHALRKGRTILIRGTPTADGTPFDLSTDRYMQYELKKPGAAKDHLARVIRATLDSDRQTDSPVFGLLPNLPEADPRVASIGPTDFGEEVERARAIGAKGWLRLLSREVRTTLFSHGGLRQVAKAQWDLNDLEGAKDSWEEVREHARDDVDANLALANIYERLWRTTSAADNVKRSQQALDRVLKRNDITPNQRAETLALCARNLKSQWRAQFKQLKTVEARRKAANSRSLIECYERYRAAFLHDLNHFWSGLAALQAGTILRDLSNEKGWEHLFKDPDEAEARKVSLARQVDGLNKLVPASISAAKETGRDDVWLRTSEADHLFLNSDDPQRLIRAYEDAIKMEDRFAWDAARGQLSLFAELGIRAESALAVIDELDQRFARSRPSEPAKTPQERQVIIFAGHRVDPKNDGVSRFPPASEAAAKALIREHLTSMLKADRNHRAFASGAPGGDILFHEVCEELGVQSTICLPMPVGPYGAECFGEYEGWLGRFLKLTSTHPVVVLSDRPGLPKWLTGSNRDPWERGNELVLEIARSQDTNDVSLLALWDGSTGTKPGGTDHMVKIVKQAGTVTRTIIDAKLLVAKAPPSPKKPTKAKKSSRKK